MSRPPLAASGSQGCLPSSEVIPSKRAKGERVEGSAFLAHPDYGVSEITRDCGDCYFFPAASADFLYSAAVNGLCPTACANETLPASGIFPLNGIWMM
jgi:hypothetical protein